MAQSPVFLPSVTTVAGNHAQGYTGDNASALNATLGANLSQATTDPAGNIYITDTGNNVIRRVDAVTGIVTTIAGTGTAGFSGDTLQAKTAQLKSPGAVRYHQGSLYIADSGNARIRVINLATGVINTFAGGGTGKNSTLDSSGTELATTIAIPSPQDMAFDGLGNMYYTTQAKPVVGKIVLSTGIAVVFAGVPANGANYAGDGGPATLAGINGVIGIAVDAQNNVYIGDGGNKAIRRVDRVTNIITTYMGGPSVTVCAAATNSVGDGCPGAQAALAGLGHISFDGSGSLLAADSVGHRVRRIAPGTGALAGIVTTIGGTGVTPSTADGNYALNTALGAVNDVSVTPGGDLLVVERSIFAVRVIHIASIFPSTALGSTSSASPFFVQTQAATGSFTLPGVADFVGGAAPTCAAGVNVTGNVCSSTVTFSPTLAGWRSSPLVFTDSNGSVRTGLTGIGLGPEASLLPGLMSTYAGTGTAGTTGDNGAATSAKLNAPATVAVDGQGNLFIADTANNEVREVSTSGTITRIAGTGSAGSTGDGSAATSALLNAPGGIAVDNAGNLYIADTGNNKIRFVDNLSGLISTYAGTGTAGYTGDSGPAASATFKAPNGLFLTPQGTLYIADTGNSVIRSIATRSGLVATFAGNSSGAGFSGDAGAATLAQLSSPKSVAADANSNVYIADSGNNRIRMVNSIGIISTLAGQQGGGYTGDGSAIATELNSPSGIAVDAAGTLYVADTLNQRIRVIAGGQITTVAGTGTAGSIGDSASSAAATVSAPLGVALDGTGNVYIADTGNNKVRKINVSNNTLTFAKTNPGSTTQAQTVSFYSSGNQTLSLASVNVPSGYIEQTSSTSTNCSTAPLTLAPGASCILQTAFNPPTIGNYPGTLTLTDNSGNASAATQSISLSGSSAYVYAVAVTTPVNIVAGTAFSGSVTVSNPVATYTGTLHFTSTDPQATLPANYTFTTADNGAHAFSFTLRTTGTQCVTVTDTTDNTVTAAGCTTVTASAPVSITVSSGNNQSANVSSTYASHLAVFVADVFGNPVPNVHVVFTAPASTNTVYAAFPGGSTTDAETTDLSGFANSAALTSGPIIGTLHVTAAATGVSAPTTFNLSIVITGSFTLVPVSSQVGPLAPGISDTQNINIVPSGGFSAPVVMSCTSPATSITCTMTPTTVAFSNSAPVSQPQLSFQSQGPLRVQSGFDESTLAILMTLTTCLVILRKRRILAAIALAVVVSIGLFSTSGCGNGINAPTTPNGTYTITVTGTAQTVTTSTTVTYTVQQ